MSRQKLQFPLTPVQMEILGAAHAHAQDSRPIFPCDPSTKKPLTTNGFKDATCDPTMIEHWWHHQFPGAMIGMPTGTASGLWAVDLDIDPDKGLDGIAAFAEIERQHGKCPVTLAAITPRGGCHLFWTWQDGIGNSTSKIGPGIDVRGEGGYVILPPSIRADGRCYQWKNGSAPGAAPAWLANATLKRQPEELRQCAHKGNGADHPAWSRAALERECASVATAPEGTRNATLNTAAFNLAQIVAGGGLDEAEVRDRLTAAARAAGLAAAEIAATLNSAGNAGREQPRGPKEDAKSNDTGAAEQKTSPASVLLSEDIMNKHFEPIKYVVPGLVVEGLTLLAGKPKVGKSWLMLHAAVAVARGGFTLGEIKCGEGDALYCALEDNQRRMQSRCRKLFGHDCRGWPRLRFCFEMPRLAEGGLNLIRQWVEAVEHPRLVVIDTLAMVRSPRRKDQTPYDADYAAVQDLRTLANRHGIAVVVIHHLRKAEGDDAFDTVSGTLGLTGAPDTILVLKRDTSGAFVIHGRGRDLVEVERAMAFNQESCTWTMSEEPVSTLRIFSERRAILEAIEGESEPLGPSDIAVAAGMKTANVKMMLARMAKDGLIEKTARGKYRLPG